MGCSVDRPSGQTTPSATWLRQQRAALVQVMNGLESITAGLLHSNAAGFQQAGLVD
jgi:hypothetical protein